MPQNSFLVPPGEGKNSGHEGGIIEVSPSASKHASEEALSAAKAAAVGLWLWYPSAGNHGWTVDGVCTFVLTSVWDT